MKTYNDKLVTQTKTFYKEMDCNEFLKSIEPESIIDIKIGVKQWTVIYKDYFPIEGDEYTRVFQVIASLGFTIKSMPDGKGNEEVTIFKNKELEVILTKYGELQ